MTRTSLFAFCAAPGLLLGACSAGDTEALMALTEERDTLAAQVAVLEGDIDALRDDVADARQEAGAASAALANAGQVPGDLSEGLAAAPVARATVINTAGQATGEALFWPASGGVLMRLAVAGLPAERTFLGLHFHAVGQCDPNGGFSSAAGHIMPTNLPHGFLNPEGPHEGNLPNLAVSPQGLGVLEHYTTLVTLDDGPAGLLDADGATVIIHENTDDHITQPIGGAGARVACGIIEPVAPASE